MRGLREIKFRYTCIRENGHIFSRIFTIEQIESSEVRQWWEMSLVGKQQIHKDQCTGLKDKNGEEIYEGDIVRYKSDALINGYLVMTVIFHSGSYMQKYLDSEDPDIWFDWDDSEVIGNIYENKKLLESVNRSE